jgi:hypothetical protein
MSEMLYIANILINIGMCMNKCNEKICQFEKEKELSANYDKHGGALEEFSIINNLYRRNYNRYYLFQQ